MLRKSMRTIAAMVCATTCLVMIAPKMHVEAYTQEEQLYSQGIFTETEQTDYISKYGDTSYITPEAPFGKIPKSLAQNVKKITLENDRTGGINVRWKDLVYSVAIERYDYSTKKWEFLAYKSGDESSAANKKYMVDLFGRDSISTTREANNYYLYEDDTVQVNKSYKYRITPFNIYSQSRSEAAALGKEAEYDKFVNDYKANGCQVIEENGYTVVFYSSTETKKVKNTLEAPYVSVKETEYCRKCKEYDTNFTYYGKKCLFHKSVKQTNQLTFDIEWQDVDGYEIYYSRYSDTGFKKWKTIKPKKITHSLTTYPAGVIGQNGVIATTFQYRTKLGNGKYFFKVRSYVIVNGKKVYSDFSPVTSKYDYILHDRLGLRECDLYMDQYDIADVQATEEYNKLNRLMNENRERWEEYFSGKITKNRLIYLHHILGEEKHKVVYKNHGIYTKKVKSITLKNSGSIAIDIETAIERIAAKKNQYNERIESIHITYTKKEKKFNIYVIYGIVH